MKTCDCNCHYGSNENNCRNCSCKNYTVSLIGIDVDTRDKKINNLIMERIKKHGTFTRKRSTNGGWHYKVNLNKIRIIKDLSDKIDLILLRFWIGDDPTRCLFDLNRMRKGFEITDVLFDKKWSGW